MSAMTIDEYIFEIKDEYPQLESEIRGILTARAQTGATIQDLRDDYQVLTGYSFPVKESITDFLLSIPHVTAMCNEHGTRIFNILPTEKTKHVYDMVIGQKPPPYKPPSYKANNNNQHAPWFNHSNNQWVGHNQQNYQHNNQYYNQWNNNQNHWVNHNTHQNNNYNNYNNHNNYNNYNNHQNQNNNYNRPSSVHTASEKNSSRTESDEPLSCFFEDNYRYLFQRFNPRDDPRNSIESNLSHGPKNPPHRYPSSVEINDLEVEANNFDNNQQMHHHVHFSQHQNHHNRNIQSIPSPTPGCVHEQMNDWNIGAHLFDFQLMGDDFFLYLARMELKCKFKPGERVLQSGLCVSGQTISAATKRVYSLNYVNRRMIINLGSVDILQGKALVQIQHDFLELLSVLRERSVVPIVTTLAPLALFAHEKAIKEKVERFNAFIKLRVEKVIDIWKCVVNEKGQTLFDCFQDKPRPITGGSESYLFWNKIGRQRVLKKIEAEIEY